jgi:hypothetical protein
MAPMIGTMADNVGRFAAVDALPPFWLFPWFFVVPGLLVAGLALAARPSRSGRDPAAGGGSARKRQASVVVGLLALVTAACGGGGGGKSSGSASATGKGLTGVLHLTAGTCAAQGARGSYFRMVQPTGTVASGPFVINGDSACADKTYTLLAPGADGGLRLGAYQPEASPPFDSGGNGTAARIAQPQKWFAVAFALATNPRDPQTGARVPAPKITLSGTSLSGDLSAFAASWNGQHFNQGAPKPGGARPGNTSGPRGVYDPTTHAFMLEWSSQIVGGPFNNFTGVWHLEGALAPA